MDDANWNGREEESDPSNGGEDGYYNVYSERRLLPPPPAYIVEEGDEALNEGVVGDGNNEPTEDSSASRPTSRPICREKRVSIPTSNQANDDDDVEKRLSYTLDGVPWGGEGQYRRKFALAFQEALRDVDLRGGEKLIIMERFVRLAHRYRNLRVRWKWISRVARVTVTVGSIVVPALITLDDDIRERSRPSQIIAYTVFGISLMVSIVNGLQELFSATQRYITFGTTEEALISEGWSFISLSGKYKRYDDHESCWRSFINRTGKIHSSAVNATMALARKPADDSQVNATTASSRAHQQRYENGNGPSGGTRSTESTPMIGSDLSGTESEVAIVYANH